MLKPGCCPCRRCSRRSGTSTAAKRCTTSQSPAASAPSCHSPTLWPRTWRCSMAAQTRQQRRSERCSCRPAWRPTRRRGCERWRCLGWWQACWKRLQRRRRRMQRRTIRQLHVHPLCSIARARPGRLWRLLQQRRAQPACCPRSAASVLRTGTPRQQLQRPARRCPSPSGRRPCCIRCAQRSTTRRWQFQGWRA